MSVEQVYGEPEGNGDCFSAAAYVLLDELPDAQLCHGHVWHEKSGRHWHAWVEQEAVLQFPDYGPVTVRSVIDRSNGHSSYLPVGAYYNLGGVDADEVRRYTRDEAVAAMLEHGHFGPWPT